MARKQSLARPSSLAEERAALFAAVKEEPDDDAPRLVLADWLEEHGDEDDRAHAELIRVQCEILRLSAALIDPECPGPIHGLLCSDGYHNGGLLPYQLFASLTENDARVDALQRRKKELIEGFGDQRLNALPIGHLCKWHRGFALLNLTFAPFRSRDMAAFAATPAAARVEALTLDVAPSRSARLARNALMAHAVGLEVRGVRLDAHGLATLLASPCLAGLRRLTLSDGVSMAGIAGAPQLDRLTDLDCRSRSGEPHLHALATSAPSLRAVDLDGHHRMGAKGAEELAAASCLAHLRELGLTNCRLGTAGLRAIVSAPHFRCPPLLHIGSNDIGPAGLRALLAAPGLEDLVVLETFNNSLDDAAVADLAGSPRLAGLLHLDLNSNPAVGPAGAEALAASPHLRRLASLEIDCPIGEAGARALLNSPHLRRLELSIDESDLRAETVAALKERYFL